MKIIADALSLNPDSTLVLFNKFDAVIDISNSGEQLKKVVFIKYKLFYQADTSNWTWEKEANTITHIKISSFSSF